MKAKHRTDLSFVSTSSPDKPVAVLITCHNRRDKTLDFLQSLFSQATVVEMDVILVDDGSTDGTSDAVREAFPQVQILVGNGDLFWSGGMRLAFDYALQHGYSAYIWLNDDVRLEPDALWRLIQTSESLASGSIVGGAMRGIVGDTAVYGGSLRSKVSPLKFSFVQPSILAPRQVSVLHGNLVLVPQSVAEQLGSVAPYLRHLGGDFEYCLRASRSGVNCYLAAGTFGVCEPNGVTTRRRGWGGLKKMLSIKEMPFCSAAALYREYGGPIWPVWLITPYIRAFIRGC